MCSGKRVKDALKSPKPLPIRIPSNLSPKRVSSCKGFDDILLNTGNDNNYSSTIKGLSGRVYALGLQERNGVSAKRVGS